jgi:hypothetical protein
MDEVKTCVLSICWLIGDKKTLAHDWGAAMQAAHLLTGSLIVGERQYLVKNIIALFSGAGFV